MATNLKLSSGATIPALGFGTWEVTPDSAAREAVAAALKTGYRLIDTAKIYGNEAGVGEAIRGSGIPREDIFVTTKLWSGELGYESALAAIDASLERLGLEYVDLYLMHWPGPIRGGDAETNAKQRQDTWRAFEEIQDSGKAKAIGVSNFTEKHLAELLEYAKVTPAVNQFEFHPFVYDEQKAIADFCDEHGIIIEGYSPLARGAKVKDSVVGEIAERLGREPSQVLLRWSMQHGAIPLPRSTNEQHIAQNFQVFDFELSADDMETLDTLTDGTRAAPDPHKIP